MKYILTLFLLLFISKSQAQKLKSSYQFGKVSNDELELKYYEKDSTAPAVIFYEKGFVKIRPSLKKTMLETTYYFKIKILKKDAYNQGDISIPLYFNKSEKENIENIKGLTHNLKNGRDVISKLTKDQIYESKLDKNWNEIKFTLPNIKVGSVIEYEYTLKSPFWTNFTGWNFQGELPKVYTVLETEIPTYFIYKKSLIGVHKLNANKSSTKKDCYKYKGMKTLGYCKDVLLAMKDVPAFKEELYLTSIQDILFRVDYELLASLNVNNFFNPFISTWDNYDYYFKNYSPLGIALQKVKFVKKNLPKTLFTEKDSLKKAMNIYHFVQNTYNRNKESNIFKKIDLKKTIKTKTGNFAEINIILINALKAAGFKSNLLLLSTRSHGKPITQHPVISNYNYAIANVKIKGFIYQLDASFKFLPFGLLPFETLNTLGRVMDLKKASYWQNILGNRDIQTKVLALKFDKGLFSGVMRITNSTYSALVKRDILKNSGQKDYKEIFENNSDMIDLKIISYRYKNLDNYDKPLIEDFKISFEIDKDDENLIVLNPFFDGQKQNPFKLKKRTYPVDFGYPETEKYFINLTVPNNFKIITVPKSVVFVLGKGDAILKSTSKTIGQNIKINYQIDINKTIFPPKDYQKLKAFYKAIVDLQNEVIILKKKL